MGWGGMGCDGGVGSAAVFREEGGRDGDEVFWWQPLSRNPITSGNCRCHKHLPFVTMSMTVGLFLGK